MGVIVDQFGRPIETRKAPERRPLAAAPIYDSWRDYVAEGLKPATLSALLKSADAGDVARQCELFEQMEEKDGHILAEKTKRANVILDVNFEVQPATEDARDAKVAEFVQNFLDGMTDYDDVLVGMQDAVGKGFAGLEMHWDVSGGQAVPTRLEWVEQKRFLFYDSAGMLCATPRLVTDADPMGVEIPAWKMLFHKYGGKSGHATRSGIYRVCAWMYLFKNYALKDWAIFCEVYGMPLRLGKYRAGAGEAEKSALVSAIASLGTDAAGVISADTEIEFVDKVQKTATADLYKLLAEFANKENSKAILGQTLTAEVGDKGSYAASQTHNEVRLDLMRADARAIAATIRHQVIRPLVGFNFGWDTPVPDYVPLYSDDPAIEEWHLRYGLLTVNEMRARLSMEPLEGGDVPTSEPAAGNYSPPVAAKLRNSGDRDIPRGLVSAKGEDVASGLPAARFTPDQQAIEDMIDDVMGRARQDRRQITADILAAIEQAGSYEDLRALLAEMLGGRKARALAERVAEAMLAGHLWGRYAER